MTKDMPPPPLCLALVMADAMHRDPGTGKLYILGTFSTIFASSFPSTHPLMTVYAVLTDGRGKIPIRLVIVPVEDDTDPLADAKGELEFSDPRMVVEVSLGLPGVTFPCPGEYRVQLLAGEELLMERRLMVIHATPSNEEQENV